MVIEGIIKRRLLLNYRIQPTAIESHLPAGLYPQLHNGYAVAGICHIRLEAIRPKSFPLNVGLSSENIAHRIAVVNEAAEPSVFVFSRYTDSCLNKLAGGRIFPGVHQPAKFSVQKTNGAIRVLVSHENDDPLFLCNGNIGGDFPDTSCFGSLDEASACFECGAKGYSVGKDNKLEGVELRTAKWAVKSFNVSEIKSGFYDDESLFPTGSIEFDHGLFMEDIPHEWHSFDPIS